MTVAEFLNRIDDCSITNRDEVALKVALYDPVTGERRLHDVRLIRSAGPGWNEIEIVPVSP